MTALDYLPNDYLRAQCATWVKPTSTERVSDTLQRAYRDARADGERLLGSALWDAWFKAKTAEGDRPDGLRRNEGTVLERFWARVIPGMDDHLYWDSSRDWQGRPIFQMFFGRTPDVKAGLPEGLIGGRDHLHVLAQRFAWQLRHGRIDPRIDVWATCGEQHCLNAEHLASAWRPRNEKQRLPDARVLEHIRACAEQLGDTPRQGDYDAWRKPSMIGSSSIASRFGSWSQAVGKAGLTPRRINRSGQYVRRYGREEILDALRAFAAELGRVPTTGDWERAEREPYRTTVSNRFGGWEGALKEAGLT